MAKVKVKKSSDFLVNKKYYGDIEPSNIKTITEEVRAYTWYHNMKDANDARKYLLEYFKNDSKYTKIINKIPDKFIPLTSAWICRLASNSKTTISKEKYEKVINSILLANTEEEEEKPKVVERPNIQDRIKERLNDIIGDVEELLDKNEAFSMYEWLQKNEIPASHAAKIAEFYKPLCHEYHSALTKDKEGYNHYSTNELKFRLNLVYKIVEDCERFAGNVKKARKPRKKKEVTADKLLRNFKYQKESNEFKLTSINPSNVLGAQELWVFNTRYNVLTVFRARGPSGLTIKRTTVEGYDEKTTIGKRVGRKTDALLKEVLNGGKVALRKVMDNINSANVVVNGRINENTILLRVQR